jgi:hypothetical protein
MRGPLVFFGIVAIGGGAFLALRGPAPETADPASAAWAEAPAPTAAVSTAEVEGGLPVMTVYRSPTCGCCGDWVEHMRAEGFTVEVENVQDLVAVKNRLGVPMPLGSCHTAVVGDYLVEGHVPADDVKRLLAEAPDAAGLAVPGMPIGSPGMEVEGTPAQPYDVLAFARDGATRVFARY